MSRAQPVALRLMTVLASVAILSDLVKEVGGSIVFAPFALDVPENFPQFHPIKFQQTGELVFAKETFSVNL